MASDNEYLERKRFEKLQNLFKRSALQLANATYETHLDRDPFTRADKERINLAHQAAEYTCDELRGYTPHSYMYILLLTISDLLNENKRLGYRNENLRQDLFDYNKIKRFRRMDGPKEIFDEFETLCKLIGEE